MYRVHLAWLPSPLLFFVFTVRLYPKRDSGRRTLESNLTHNQCVGFPQHQQGLVRLGHASPAPYAARMTSRHCPPASLPPTAGGRGFYVTACIGAELSKKKKKKNHAAGVGGFSAVSHGAREAGGCGVSDGGRCPGGEALRAQQR